MDTNYCVNRFRFLNRRPNARIDHGFDLGVHGISFHVRDWSELAHVRNEGVCDLDCVHVVRIGDKRWADERGKIGKSSQGTVGR